MKENLVFRLWYYFRQGWSIYFAFIFSAINTLVVTYYLAIERAPFLKEIFPSFLYYVLILVGAGIPLLVLIGYAHVKKSAAYKAEADIGFEANPHFRRMLLNTEHLLRQNTLLNELLLKLSNNQTLTESEINEIKNIQNELKQHIDKKTIKE